MRTRRKSATAGRAEVCTMRALYARYNNIIHYTFRCSIKVLSGITILLCVFYNKNIVMHYANVCAENSFIFLAITEQADPE